jgi:hypothetical protein
MMAHIALFTKTSLAPWVNKMAVKIKYRFGKSWPYKNYNKRNSKFKVSVGSVKEAKIDIKCQNCTVDFR